VFAIVDVPTNRFLRWINGQFSNYLALTYSCVSQYKYSDDLEAKFAKQTPKTYAMYLAMQTIGFISSIIPCQKWAYYFDKHSASYHKRGLTAIPSGRKHYLGETNPYTAMLPAVKGVFEGLEVSLPNDVNAYLTRLYGADYMQLPPVEKRERHFIVDLDFGKYDTDV
jgi:lipopolysaccharide cholinephosphotransferase